MSFVVGLRRTKYSTTLYGFHTIILLDFSALPLTVISGNGAKTATTCFSTLSYSSRTACSGYEPEEQTNPLLNWDEGLRLLETHYIGIRNDVVDTTLFT